MNSEELEERYKSCLENSDFISAKKMIESLQNIDDLSIEDGTVIIYSISKGADIDFIEYLIDKGYDPKELTVDGVNILDEAILVGDVDLVKYLIRKYKFDVNSTSRKSGFTPLITAVSYGREEIARYLISKGADIEKRDINGLGAKDYARKLGKNSEYL
jgi:ankyrin repeat protein